VFVSTVSGYDRCLSVSTVPGHDGVCEYLSGHNRCM